MSIEAMKLALEALVKLRGFHAFHNKNYENEITALCQAIEQAQKQEPVAYDTFKDWMVREMPPTTTISNPEWWAKRIYERFIYTSPPQRECLVCIERAMMEVWQPVKPEQEPVAFEMDWPEFHQKAMGCGLEDRNITDRYEAMQYGWEEALDRCAERLPDELYTSPPQRKPLTDLKEALVEAMSIINHYGMHGWSKAAHDEGERITKNARKALAAHGIKE